jgi:hypothetical protein
MAETVRNEPVRVTFPAKTDIEMDAEGGDWYMNAQCVVTFISVP